MKMKTKTNRKREGKRKEKKNKNPTHAFIKTKLLILAGVAVVAIAAFVFLKYSKNRDYCRASLVEFSASRENLAQLSAQLDSKDEEAASKLLFFLERVGFDWKGDKNGPDRGPDRALGIRVQGVIGEEEKDALLIRNILKQALGETCYQERVKIVSLRTDPTPEATAGKFLKQVKAENGPEAVAIVLLEDCEGEKEVQRAMHFKSFLEASFTTEDNVILSGRGVGFIFLGNGLSEDPACDEKEILDLDTAKGWASNMRSRMVAHVGLCKRS